MAWFARLRVNTDIPRVELLVRGKKSFGHVKIDAKRVSDSGVLCTVVDLHKREEL